MDYKLTPTADRILVKTERTEVSKLYLPDLKKPRYKNYGIVEEAGEGCENAKKGDKVWFGNDVGKEIEEFYLLMREVDLIWKKK